MILFILITFRIIHLLSIQKLDIFFCLLMYLSVCVCHQGLSLLVILTSLRPDLHEQNESYSCQQHDSHHSSYNNQDQLPSRVGC